MNTAQFEIAHDEPYAGQPVAVYDATAEQRYTFEIEDDDAKYEITQVFAPLDDRMIEEYDRLRELTLEGDGKKTDLQTNAVAADEYLFDDACLDVIGYEGEKPDDWKDRVPYDEKKAGLSKLLAIKIVSGEGEKVTRKRSWSTNANNRRVELRSYFNGVSVLTSAEFRQPTPADIAKYAVIKNRISLVERGIDANAIKIPASIARKAALFDSLKPTVFGYAGDFVPLHHKAAFVTGLFEAKIAATEKK